MPPRRSSRSTRASVEPEAVEPLPVKRKRGVAAEPDYSEKENVGKPPSRARRSSSLRASVEPASNGRVSTRSRGTLPEVPESGDEDETDSPPPVKKARPSIDPEDPKDNEDRESDFDQPQPKHKGRRVASEKKGKPAVGGRYRRDTAEGNSPVVDGAHVEEDEKSLFDPPPMPAPLSLPQTIAEEPAGPKARLVIHKMALVNFKSYAGRQEIGPFHKVGISITSLGAMH